MFSFESWDAVGMLKKILLYLCFFLTMPVWAVMDNRFRDPVLIYHPFLEDQACSAFSVQPFLETSNNSFNEYGKRDALFNFGTKYRLRELDKSLIASGRTAGTLIPTHLQGTFHSGPYNMEGRIEIQGVAFNAYAPLNDWFAVGTRGEFLHATSRMELIKNAAFDTGVILGPGDAFEVLLLKESVHKALDLNPPGRWSAFMVGDAEVYGRFFTTLDHRYKCRFLDVGASVGLVLPAADARDINSPSSIPLGGDRHWGAFLEFNADLILKQDLRAGCRLRVQNRFGQTMQQRVPVGLEPEMFGAVVGDFYVNPGYTIGFFPYFVVEELRGGLGGFVAYSLVKHKKDKFSDQRVDQSVAVNFNALTCNSSWGYSYVTLGFLYDFGQGKKCREFDPVITCKIDAPVDFLVSERSSKTYGLTMIAEVSF